MDLFELLQRGYFPKELPPAFNTYKFALKGQDFLSVLSSTDLDSSPAHYSIEKSNVSRRDIHIPNPINYLKLADLIVRNERVIFNNIPSSDYSVSKAYYESDISKRCIVPKGFPMLILQREKMKMAMTKRLKVKLDVANFYPSIYTHSVSWALLGRNTAKAIWGMSSAQRNAHSPASEVQLYHVGEQIDKALRNCNDKQTHGILVGPDVSFLIGELIMSRIDANMALRFPDLKGTRYYDDYTFYVNKEEEADALYQALQAELRSFGLEVNEAKYIKKVYPSPIQDDFVREMSPIRVPKNIRNRNKGLLLLFDVMWKCAEQRPESTLTIFKYGLRFLINQRIRLDRNNKDMYEPLLYKMAVLKPSILHLICKILDLGAELPTKELLKETVFTIFKLNVPYAQENEVAWALWLCKKYDVKIETSEVCNILKMGSTVCTIILLDILHNRQKQTLVEPEVQQYIRDIKSGLCADSLYTEDWLLMYETSIHGWIDNSATILADQFFKFLYQEKIMFYDENVAANYSSYDYIETLPYDFYPSPIKKKANILKNKIIGRVKKVAFNKYFDEDSERDIKADDLKEMIESEIEDLNMGSDLFARILNPVFRGEDVDEDQLVKEYLAYIELYQEY